MSEERCDAVGLGGRPYPLEIDCRGQNLETEVICKTCPVLEELSVPIKLTADEGSAFWGLLAELVALKVLQNRFSPSRLVSK
jgi:hypothetical protein